MRYPLQVRIYGMTEPRRIAASVMAMAIALERYHREILACRIGIEGNEAAGDVGVTVRIGIRVTGSELTVTRVDTDLELALKETIANARWQLGRYQLTGRLPSAQAVPPNRIPTTRGNREHEPAEQRH